MFEAVFRGMNIGYKRAGLMAVTTLVGGVLMIIAINAGGGLVAVASVQAATTFLYLTVFSVVVKHHLPWLAIKIPHRSDVIDCVKKSAWFALWAFVSTLIFLGEVVLLGLFGNASLVSKYVVTAFAVQSIVVIVSTAVMAALPGLGGVIGKGDYVKARSIRKESLAYTWVLACCIAGLTVLFNESFVANWVGSAKFAGNFESLIIVVCALQLVFIRQDAAMINLAIDVRQKVKYSLASALVCIVLAAFLVPLYGIVGVCLAMLIGRSILSYFFPRIIGQFLRFDEEKFESVKPLYNIVIVAVVVLVCFYISSFLTMANWFSLIVSAAILMPIFFYFSYRLLLSADHRDLLLQRLYSLKTDRRL